MPWNPDKYNEFKTERYKPFFDLVSHIKDKPNLKVLDLGCGTGELTKFLADKLTHPTVLGIHFSLTCWLKYRNKIICHSNKGV